MTTEPRGPRIFWETRDRYGCTSRALDEQSARRGCLNDTGRLLSIYSPAGQLAALYRDGKEVED